MIFKVVILTNNHDLYCFKRYETAIFKRFFILKNNKKKPKNQ